MSWGERGLAVFVRRPEPGRVLPAIAARLGAEAAAELYEAFIGDLVAAVPMATYDTHLYCADGLEHFRARYPEMTVRPQVGRNEGRRLHACFEELLAEYPLAVVTGSSIPDLHPRLLQSAFEMLQRRDVVVGPTERGGIYLLGMREPRDVFRDLRWGTGSELAALLRNLEREHLDYGFFPTRPKVETYEDLMSLRRRLV
ncbi:MAG TPA: DUF2064 domain-containing protein, partial [Planctomycetota bacterium]|nr:DUF2064 domain-containing protein [Planctomycetota bacterium]